MVEKKGLSIIKTALFFFCFTAIYYWKTVSVPV